LSGHHAVSFLAQIAANGGRMLLKEVLLPDFATFATLREESEFSFSPRRKGAKMDVFLLRPRAVGCSK